MTIKRLFFILIAGFLLYGCAWVDTKTQIVKDSNNNIVKSEYTRTYKGMTPFGDKENSRSWAGSDQIARSNRTNQYTEYLGKNYSNQNITENEEAPIMNKDGKMLVRVRNTIPYTVQVTSPKLLLPTIDPGYESELIPLSLGMHTVSFVYVTDNGRRQGSFSVMVNKNTSLITIENKHRDRF